MCNIKRLFSTLVALLVVLFVADGRAIGVPGAPADVSLQSFESRAYRAGLRQSQVTVAFVHEGNPGPRGPLHASESFMTDFYYSNGQKLELVINRRPGQHIYQETWLFGLGHAPRGGLRAGIATIMQVFYSGTSVSQGPGPA